MYALLLGANVVVWVLAFFFFAPPHALLLGTALLAYTFGLRHAVDADHISAIDNVTRKLMQEGKQPVAVGFYFSLGHSTVVVALTLAIVLGASAVRDHLPALEGFGSIVGTGVSAAFLFVIAAINAFVLVDIVRAVRRMQNGGTFCEQTLNESLDRRGLLRDVSDVMALEQLSIEAVNSNTDPRDRIATIVMRTAVRDSDQLGRVLQRLSAVPNVLSAQRLS